MTCEDRLRLIYPKNVKTLQETLFEMFEGFNIPISKDNTLLNNLAVFDFESICVPSNKLKDTQTKLGLANRFQFLNQYLRT